jgi:3-oxoadipate enol-lactonase
MEDAMTCLDLGDVALHYADTGPKDAPAVVFSNSLGTDFRLWDSILPYMPEGLRVIRYDKRGHGLSSCPPAPYTMGALIHDAERLLDALGVRDCVFVGLSIGGMIAQGLAAKRLDLVRAVVLSNTAPKIGTREMWAERIRLAETEGVAAMSDAIMERWFSRDFRETTQVWPWRRMVETTPAAGYAGCSAAIAGTDFYSTTGALRLPALVIGGSEDGSTPPDLVRELASLIPGARFELIRGAGHLPCVEKPEVFGPLLAGFLREIGHAGAPA